jgi:hypothetical protein
LHYFCNSDRTATAASYDFKRNLVLCGATCKAVQLTNDKSETVAAGLIIQQQLGTAAGRRSSSSSSSSAPMLPAMQKLPGVAGVS